MLRASEDEGLYEKGSENYVANEEVALDLIVLLNDGLGCNTRRVVHPFPNLPIP